MSKDLFSLNNPSIYETSVYLLIECQPLIPEETRFLVSGCISMYISF